MDDLPRESRSPRDEPFSLPALLDAVENVTPADAMRAVADQVRAGLASLTPSVADPGNRLPEASLRLLLADYGGELLVALDVADHGGHTVPIADTPQGACLRRQQMEILGPDAAHNAMPATSDEQGESFPRRWCLLAPVTTRGEAIGVLQVVVPTRPDDQMRQALSDVAHLFAYLLMVNRRFTDYFERQQRTRPLALAAEIQRRLLPAAMSAEMDSCTLAGWLEPAYEAGGDNFDFTQERNHLSVTISDAMGHGIGSSLLSTLAVAALRNQRRQGKSLTQQAAEANRALVEHGKGDALAVSYVTGQLVHIDFTDGRTQIINAGHVLPRLLRNGRVEELSLAADLPLGLFANTRYQLQQLVLMPGDRLLLLTDGLLDRGGMTDALLRRMLLETAGLHPRETVRAVAGRIKAVGDGPMRDDATTVCIDWHGEPTGR